MPTPANTNNKLTSNSHGSFKTRIVVRVDMEHVEAFKEAFGTQPFRTLPHHSDFIVKTSATKRGDDETVMYDIDYKLPDLPSFKGWRVLWDESVY